MSEPTSIAPRWAGAVVGVVSAAAGLAAAELVAGLSASMQSPVVVVGDRVVDGVPRAVKDWAISTFGRDDKTVLLAGVAILLAVAAALIGIIAVRRSLRVGLVGVAAFAGVGLAAALGRGSDGWESGIPSIVAGVVAGGVMVLLARTATTASDTPMPLAGGGSRRRFLTSVAAVGAAAIVTGGLGRWLADRAAVVGERLKVVLPRPARPLRAVAPTAHAPGAVPFVTPNDEFYRVDTALSVPRVSTDGWTLTVTGRVAHELSLTYRELLDRPMVEADVTIACVSNEVGGNLVGTARWLGCRLDDLLAEAGVADTADQVVGRSVDGFTAGFPTSLLDGRPALVAVGMNGEPLPIEHGYPARLIVPGVYGYVSATKWLTGVELTRFDEFDAYWIPRGWSRFGPIKTQSRIDSPRDGATVPAGRATTIAGVAWAMDRGITRVEVAVDGPGDRQGEWRPAILADELNDTTWRQWHLRWTPAESGEHAITVRATDGRGETQTRTPSDVAPDGATGWHTIRVAVG